MGWGVGDQAISSGTNFLAAVAAARSLTSADFGAFSIVIVTYTLLVGSSRAATTEPLLVRFSGPSTDEKQQAARAAVGATLIAGLGLGGVCLVTGLAVGGQLGDALAMLGITLPGLLVQDGFRMCFFARGQTGRAAINDTVWAVLLGIGLVALHFRSHTTATDFLLVWGASASGAAVYGVFQASFVPQLTRGIRWWWSQRELSWRFAAEFATYSGGAMATTYVVGATGSLSGVASLRGAETILGPLTVIFLGTRLIAIPLGVAALAESPSALRRHAVWVSGLLAASALLIGVCVMKLPDAAGHALLGSTWHGAQGLVLPIAIMTTGTGLSIGAGVGLRALGAASYSLRARLLIAPLALVLGTGGALLAHADGAAWGLAASSLLSSAVWWRMFTKGLAHRFPDSDPDHKLGSQPMLIQPG
jgi:hypothetical protein